MKHPFENFNKKLVPSEGHADKGHNHADSNPVPLEDASGYQLRKRGPMTISPEALAAQPPKGWLFEAYGDPEPIGDRKITVGDFRMIVINTRNSQGKYNAHVIERRPDGNYEVFSSNIDEGIIPKEVAEKLTLQRGYSFYYGGVDTPPNTSPVTSGTVYK